MSPRTTSTGPWARAHSRFSSRPLRQIVEHDDASGAGRHELVTDGRADEARAPGDDRDAPVELDRRSHQACSSAFRVPPSARLADAACSTSSTRRPDSPLVIDSLSHRDGVHELVDHGREGLALAEGRRHHVAGAVGDDPTEATGVGQWFGLDLHAGVEDLDPLGGLEVVPDHHAARPADHHPAHLRGRQPVHVGVGQSAVAQRHREVSHTALSGSHRIGAARGHRPGPSPGGQHVVEDGQVMGGEVPYDVDVTLDEAEVHPHGVHVEDLAQLAPLDDRADVLHSWRVAVRVVAHQYDACVPCRVDELLPILQAGGERLLDEDVLAGVDGSQAQVEVGARWCGDGDDVDLGVGEHDLDILGGADQPVAADRPPGPLLVDVAHPPQVDAIVADEVAHQVRSPVAGADHRCPEPSHHVADPRHLPPRRPPRSLPHPPEAG